MEIDGIDGLVCELIGAAVLAGAYRTLARAEPGAERGLLKLAAKWSARVAALANGIQVEALIADRASAPMPKPLER